MTTVQELRVGDVVEVADRWGIFLGRSQHPKYSRLQAVTWWLDGAFMVDALSAHQDVGDVVSKVDVNKLLKVGG